MKYALLVLVLLGASINLHSQASPLNENSIFSQDGISFYLPRGWAVKVNTSIEPLRIYSAENNQSGVFIFFRIEHPISMEAKHFARMSIQQRNRHILSLCDCVVLNSPLEVVSRHIYNGELVGVAGKYAIQQRLPPHLTVEHYQEFYHVDVGSDRVFISANSEKNSLDELELFAIFTSLSIY